MEILNFLLGVATGEQRQPLFATMFVERLTPTSQAVVLSFLVFLWISCQGLRCHSRLQSLERRTTFLFSLLVLLVTAVRGADLIDSLVIGQWLQGMLISPIDFFQVGDMFFGRVGSDLSDSLFLKQQRKRCDVRDILHDCFFSLRLKYRRRNRSRLVQPQVSQLPE